MSDLRFWMQARSDEGETMVVSVESTDKFESSTLAVACLDEEFRTIPASLYQVLRRTTANEPLRIVTQPPLHTQTHITDRHTHKQTQTNRHITPFQLRVFVCWFVCVCDNLCVHFTPAQYIPVYKHQRIRVGSRFPQNKVAFDIVAERR